MKGCFKFVVVFALLIIAASFARSYLLLTPEQRAAEVAREATPTPAQVQRVESSQTQPLDIPHKKTSEDLQAKQQRAGELQTPYLEELVNIEGVERAEFTDLTHLKLRLKPLMHIGTDHVRVMCENVAKGWAARSGMTPVVCEEWYGEKMYATGEYTGPVPEAYLLTVMAEKIKEQRDKNTTALAAMQGKTLAEIEGTHGKALSKSAETGWAEFRTFRARFANGKVAEVSVK